MRAYTRVERISAIYIDTRFNDLHGEKRNEDSNRKKNKCKKALNKGKILLCAHMGPRQFSSVCVQTKERKRRRSRVYIYKQSISRFCVSSGCTARRGFLRHACCKSSAFLFIVLLHKRIYYICVLLLCLPSCITSRHVGCDVSQIITAGIPRVICAALTAFHVFRNSLAVSVHSFCFPCLLHAVIFVCNN